MQLPALIDTPAEVRRSTCQLPLPCLADPAAVINPVRASFPKIPDCRAASATRGALLLLVAAGPAGGGGGGGGA